MNLSDLNLPDHQSLPEQQIRELAYQIWESEGKPHGQDARHWDIACKLAAESLAPAPAAIAKKPRARKTAAAPEAIAPAVAAPAAAAKAPRSRKASAGVQAGETEAPAAKPARKTKAKNPKPDITGLVPEVSEPEVNSTEPQPG